MAAPPTPTGPPDFVGVGTQRSGTTWWFETLLGPPADPRRRAGAARSSTSSTASRARELTEADIADYHARFPRKPGQIAGEWTPRYMHDFWTPRLIARAAPGAKLLIMFRDPIERFRSGVPHRQSQRPDHRLEAVTADAIERGKYATQLRRVLACHDRVEAPDPPVREVRRRPGRPVPPHAGVPRRRPRPRARGLRRSSAARRRRRRRSRCGTT